MDFTAESVDFKAGQPVIPRPQKQADVDSTRGRTDGFGDDAACSTCIARCDGFRFCLEVDRGTPASAYADNLQKWNLRRQFVRVRRHEGKQPRDECTLELRKGPGKMYVHRRKEALRVSRVNYRARHAVDAEALPRTE